MILTYDWKSWPYDFKSYVQTWPRKRGERTEAPRKNVCRCITMVWTVNQTYTCLPGHTLQYENLIHANNDILFFHESDAMSTRHKNAWILEILRARVWSAEQQWSFSNIFLHVDPRNMQTFRWCFVRVWFQIISWNVLYPYDFKSTFKCFVPLWFQIIRSISKHMS